MGRPAGVGDAVVSHLPGRLSGQFRHAADAAQPGKPRIQHSDPGGVVPAVLKFLQALNEDRDDVAGGDGRDDATHKIYAFFSFTGRFQPGSESCFGRVTVS